MALYKDEDEQMEQTEEQETSPHDQQQTTGNRPSTGAAKRAKQMEAAKRRKDRQRSAIAQQTEKPGAARPRTITVKSNEEGEGTGEGDEEKKPEEEKPPEYTEKPQSGEEIQEKPAEKKEKEKEEVEEERKTEVVAESSPVHSPKKKSSHSSRGTHGHHSSKKSSEQQQQQQQQQQPKPTETTAIIEQKKEAEPEKGKEPEKPQVVVEPEKEKPKDTRSELERRGIASTFDPLASNGNNTTTTAPVTANAAVVSMAKAAPAINEVTQSQASNSLVVDPRSLSLGNIAAISEFVSKPGERGRYIQCKIQRVSKVYSQYFCYLDETNQFLLSARKRKRSASSNYIISLDQADLSRASASFCGKVRSNFMGTEFQVYDNGTNPKKLDKKGKDKEVQQVTSAARRELATVLYGTNVLGLQGPRKMTILVPKIDSEGKMQDNQPLTHEQTLAGRFREGKSEAMLQFQNKAPVWNDETQSYVLNFRKRVKMPSVKNFQVVSTNDPDEVIMQFGRVTEFTFAMDYQYPLTLVQAFGIALSSFDSKLACE